MKPLNDTQLAVMHAEIMTSTDKEAKEYLNKNGHKMALRTYKTHKKNIHLNDTQRLYDMAKTGKENQMQRIDEFKLIKTEQWKIYRNSTDDNVKLRALRQIRDIEPYIAASEAAIPYIIRDVIENFGKGESGNSKKQEHKESISTSTS